MLMIGNMFLAKALAASGTVAEIHWRVALVGYAALGTHMKRLRGHFGALACKRLAAPGRFKIFNKIFPPVIWLV